MILRAKLHLSPHTLGEILRGINKCNLMSLSEYCIADGCMILSPLHELEVTQIISDSYAQKNRCGM